ncbi:MAG TPA: hypothetical protein VGG41_15680 [Solirubrobacteraceae bacterium]
MALDASQLLGSEQLAGVKVNPRGMARRVAGPIGGEVAARVVLGPRAERTASETPKFARLAYLVLTGDELALVELKSGIVKVHLGEVLKRTPRSEVASAELGKGLVPPLTIGFADGDRWELEVPGPSRKHARTLVDALVR